MRMDSDIKSDTSFALGGMEFNKIEISLIEMVSSELRSWSKVINTLTKSLLFIIAMLNSWNVLFSLMRPVIHFRMTDSAWSGHS